MRKKILPFVTTYHPALPNLKNILMSKWHLIQDQPLLREIYNEPPIISYKRAKSLGDISLEQNYKVMYHTITSLRVVFGLSTPSTDGLDQRSLKRERKFRSRVENFQGRV